MNESEKVGWLTLLFLFVLGFAMAVSATVHAQSSKPTDGPIMRALLSLPTFHEDRGADVAEQKRAQLVVIANAIGAASKGDRDLAAPLVTTAYHESGNSMRIHAGLCKDRECDHGLATSLWQIHSSKHIPFDQWVVLAGTDPEATKAAAKVAAQMLLGARFACGKDPARVLTSYAGLRCDANWNGLAPRLATYARIRGRL